MVVADNAGSRGKVKRAQKKKQKTAVKTQKADIGSKRKLNRFGKRQLSGKTGVAVHYVSRSRALRMLQISLKDFRRLCILKGIYPRDPPKKPSGRQATAYYASKDIAFLHHEPILAKFREMKAVAKKIARKLGRKEDSEARRLFLNRPRYSLDHVVRERYPTFNSVLADLDDGLTLVNLFAYLPVSLASRDHGPRCSRIAREWQFYVAKSKTLRKAFVSIKGVYYQAEVHGQPITWLVPHKFSQDVTSLQENKEIDFRVMKTFLEFYETLLEFVMFKLYREDLQAAYPPTLLADADEAGAFLKALRADPLAASQKAVNKAALTEPAAKRTKRDKAAAAEEKSLEKVLAETAAKYQKILKNVGKEAEDDDEEDEDEQEEVGEEFANDDAEAKAVLENERATLAAVNLFKGFRVFLSREVPLDSCEFIVESFGGVALREDLGDIPTDATITHHITDRPIEASSMIQSREYVQPQWLFDCVNAKMILPCAEYSPLNSSLPPHLSPFVDDEAEGYKPARAQQLEELRKARAGGGGTEAYLKATGSLKAEKEESGAGKAEIEDEDDDSSSDEEEEEEDDDADSVIEGDEEEEPDTVGAMEAEDEEMEDEEEVKVKAPEPFIPATAFKGAKPGFFFRRGPQGLGYYMDASSVASEKFDAEKDAKQNVKEVRKAETVEAKQMRTIMMSKKSKHLYERMQYGLNKKKEGVEALEKKRAEAEMKASSTTKTDNAPPSKKPKTKSN